jgi:nucleoside-diphosphate-sugar epimerase
MDYVLLIGSGSKGTLQYLERNDPGRIIRVSSGRKFYSNTYNYNDKNIFKYTYSKVLIASSGLPFISTEKDYYDTINNSIKNIINNISFSENAKITLLSSFSIFKKNSQYINDKSDPNPENNYGLSKVELEIFLNNFCKKNKINLNILRLPVFLYKGVTTNFMGVNLQKSLRGETIIFTNKHSYFSAVIQDEIVYELDDILNSGFNILNLGSVGDITFGELSELFQQRCFAKVVWKETDLPSTIVDTKNIEIILRRKIISSSQINRWFNEELGK